MYKIYTSFYNVNSNKYSDLMIMSSDFVQLNGNIYDS